MKTPIKPKRFSPEWWAELSHRECWQSDKEWRRSTQNVSHAVQSPVVKCELPKVDF